MEAEVQKLQTNLKDIKLTLAATQAEYSGDRYILGHQNLSLTELLEKLSEITGLPAPRWTVPGWLPLTVAWIEEKILLGVALVIMFSVGKNLVIF